MTHYDEAVSITSQLTLVEKVQLMEYLSTAILQALNTEAYRHISWERFLDLTYGSLAHDPIERNQPEQADVRDEIE